MALVKQIGILNIFVQWNGDGVAIAPLLTALSMMVFFIYGLLDYWEESVQPPQL